MQLVKYESRFEQELLEGGITSLASAIYCSVCGTNFTLLKVEHSSWCVYRHRSELPVYDVFLANQDKTLGMINAAKDFLLGSISVKEFESECEKKPNLEGEYYSASRS